MRLRTTLPTLAAVLLLAAACTTGAVEPEGLTASPTAPSPSPTTAPTPTPDADGILEQSDSELGVELVDVPDLTGTEADVYDVVALYRKAYWSTMTTNEVHPLFDVLTSPELKAVMEDVAATNTASNVTVGGTYRLAVRGITVTDGGTATAETCSDYADVTFGDPDGSYAPDEVGYGERRLHVHTLHHTGSAWQVITSDRTGTC